MGLLIDDKTMKKLLYFGHSYHHKTKSNQFLLDRIRGHFDISEIYFDPQNATEYDVLEKYKGSTFDIVVIWQIMPDPQKLREYISWRHGVFFPMFDFFQGYMTFDCPVWHDYADFTIISFSRKLHDILKEAGFDSHYVQYFPKPIEKVTSWGDENSVFFWQRLTSLNLSTFGQLFCKSNVNNLHLHKALDPGESFTSPESFPHSIAKFLKKLHISESVWFSDKAEMLDAMQKSAIYMAPRPYEGIGMSFLEAMANGRCVVAPDCPTMNEYITHGKNGLLYPWIPSSNQELAPLDLGNIRAMQENAWRFIRDGYAQWEQDQEKILKWLQEEARPDLNREMETARKNGWIDIPIEEQPRPDAQKAQEKILIKNPEKSTEATEPVVTVVTIVFNAIKGGRKEFLRQSLDSVQRQTGVPIEHLIIDGASKDGTLEFLKDYKNPNIPIRLLSEPDKGIYDAMNKGLWLAKGKYVIFLNSDDYYSNPRGLHESVKCLEESGCDFSYAPVQILDDNGQIIDHANCHPNINYIFVNMEFSHQSMMHRRDSLLAIHGFDLRYRSAADYDSVLRLIFTGHRACYVPCSFVVFRLGGYSFVNEGLSQHETGTIFSRVYKKYLDFPLSREEGYRLYLTRQCPLELKRRQFRYALNAFGSLVYNFSVQSPSPQLNDLFVFRDRLVAIKHDSGIRKALRKIALLAISNPRLFLVFCWHYIMARRLVNDREAAAKNAWNTMFFKTQRRLKRNLVAQDSSVDVKSCDYLAYISNQDYWHVDGVYNSEPWGVWGGKKISFEVNIPQKNINHSLAVDFIIGGFVFEDSPKRVVEIFVNGHLAGNIVLEHIFPELHHFVIPAKAVDSSRLDIELVADADFVPREIGKGEDVRRLGISFRELFVCQG